MCHMLLLRFHFMTGQPYHAEVEYAPWQKVPATNQKRDPREGTIEAGGWKGKSPKRG